MNLLDYILTLDQNDKSIEYWLEKDCRCEVHKIDLEVGDGYQIIGCDISFYLDHDFLKLNPNCVIMYDRWREPKMCDFKKSKIIFCEICEKNRQEHSTLKDSRKRESRM